MLMCLLLQARSEGMSNLSIRRPITSRMHQWRMPPTMMELQVYSTAGCKYCRLAKATLTEQGIPFRSIDITTYSPRQTYSVLDKEEETQIEGRVAFTKQRTVPQIFVGIDHIGGCNELIQELASGLLMQRLAKWNVQRVYPAFAAEGQGQDVGGGGLATRIEAPPSARRAFLNSAPLAPESLPAPPSAPSQSAQALRAAADLSVAVQSSALGLTDAFAVSTGAGAERIDYAAMASSRQYQDFEHLAAQLSDLRFSTLAAMPPHGKAAFWVNIYNALIIHASAAVGSPADSPAARGAFFSGATGVRYCIAGFLLSPDDIEHGILRGNALHALPAPPAATATSAGEEPTRAPYFSRRPAVYCNSLPAGPVVSEAADQPRCSPLQHESADPRLGLCIPADRCDPRIHFVLNCGARSCPPVRVLAGSEREIEAGLAAAAAAYLGSEVKVRGEGGENRAITLPRLLLWYGADFGDSLRAVCERACGMMRPGPEREALAEALRGWGDMQGRVTYGEYSWAPATYK